MEEVKQNIKTFLEILRKGSSESVIHWDESNFKRAQRWAKYAEEVYRKLKNKPSLMQVLSNHIKMSQISSKDTFVTNFTFKDLQNATEMLRLVLLKNPHLSSAQFSQVLDMYQDLDFSTSSSKDLEKLILDTYSISCSKGIFTTLSSMRNQLSVEQSKKDWEIDNAQGTCLDTYAKLLWTKIENLMGKEKERSLTQNDVIRNIESLVLSNEKGMEVVLRMSVLQMTAKIPMNEPCNNDNVSDRMESRILNWIVECSKHSGTDTCKRIWSCPSSLLCEMSNLDTSFFESYLTYLHSRGDSLLGIGSEQAEDNETSHGYCYRHIIEQIQMLIQGPEHVSEACKQKLQLWISSPGRDSINTNPEIPSKNQILRTKLWNRIYHELVNKPTCQ